MTEIRKTIAAYDKVIVKAEDLKTSLSLLKTASLPPNFKITRTIDFLVSANDHIIDNLTRIRQRIVTRIEGD